MWICLQNGPQGKHFRKLVLVPSCPLEQSSRKRLATYNDNSKPSPHGLDMTEPLPKRNHLQESYHSLGQCAFQEPQMQSSPRITPWKEASQLKLNGLLAVSFLMLFASWNCGFRWLGETGRKTTPQPCLIRLFATHLSASSWPWCPQDPLDPLDALGTAEARPSLSQSSQETRWPFRNQSTGGWPLLKY